MSKKHKGGPAPVPPGNQPRTGPLQPVIEPAPILPHGSPPSEHDPKRRLGNYGTAGEHPIEQPSGKSGPNK